MRQRPPRSTRSDARFPYTSLCRSKMSRLCKSNNWKKDLLRGGASAAALLAMSAGAYAQTGAGDDTQGNQTIVWTATKRAATVQDVPFSINAQTEADIQRSGAVTIEDL